MDTTTRSVSPSATHPAVTAVAERPWHALDSDVALEAFAGSEHGLDTDEAQARLTAFGPNRLPQPARRSAFVRFLLQFHNVLIYTLLAAAILSALLEHWVDAGVVLAVTLANAIIGFIQEGKAVQALEAIRGMIDPKATVLRDGHRVTVSADTIVPGDIVLVEAGARVPADIRLVRARGLRIDEAILTGESVPADKAALPVEAQAAIGDRRSMAFSGTFVAAGQGVGIAVATGTEERARTHQHAARRGRNAADAAGAPDGSFRHAAHRRHPGRFGGDPSLRALLPRLFARRRLHGGGRYRGLGDPRGPAGDHDHHAGHRRAAHGGAPRHHPPAAGGRDPGLGDGHLLRQDRHADPQRDVG